MSLESNFLDYLEERELTKTGLDPLYDLPPISEPTVTPRQQKNAIYDFLGSGLWSFADEYLFGAPEIGLHMAGLEPPAFGVPETIPGKVGAAIGGTAGFVTGLPMKVGHKAASLIARPFLKSSAKAGIKAAKAQVAKETKEKVVKEFTKDLGKSYEEMILNSRRGGKFAEDFVSKANKFIGDSANDAIKRGVISEAEGEVVKRAFFNNIKERPMLDFTDILVARIGGRTGWALGSMIHEGLTFGAIDAISESGRSYTEERSYDWTAPIWGVMVGAGFGTLKWMDPAGKGARGSKDFMTGLRATLARNPYKKLSKDELYNASKWLGEDLKAAGGKHMHSVNYKGESLKIDLADPGSFITSFTDAQQVEILSGLLNKVKNTEGRKLMLSVLSKEEFPSIIENWRRMVAGTLIMNTRTIVDMSQGHTMPLEDVLTNVIIGAYLNRKGIPRTYDMNHGQMQRMRRNMDLLGFRSENMIEAIPSMHEGTYSPVNPLKHPYFKQVLGIAVEKEVVTDNFEKSNTTVTPEKGVSSKVTGKDLGIFNEFYRWLSGATGYRHLKMKDAISEKDALDIQNEIKKINFEGRKINNVEDFREALSEVVDASSERFVDKVKGLVHRVSTEVGLSTVKPSGTHIGDIPESIRISSTLNNMAEKGEIKWLRDANGEVMSGEAAVKKLTDLQIGINQANRLLLGLGRADVITNVNNKDKEITDPNKLHNIYKAVRDTESSINRGFDISKSHLLFKFTDVSELKLQLANSEMRRATDNINKLLSSDSPIFDKLFAHLADSGLVIRDPETAIGGRLVHNFAKIKIKDSDELSANQLKEAKSFLNTIGNILSVKGEFKIDKISEPSISINDINRLKDFLDTHKMNVKPEMLEMFGHEVTRRILMDKIQGTNVNDSHISAIQQLMNFEYPMAEYASIDSGVSAGFLVHKINTVALSRNIKRWANEYNIFVDEMHKAGRKPGQLGSFIKIGDTIDIVPGSSGKNAIKVMWKISRESKDSMLDYAETRLLDFVSTLETTDRMRGALHEYTSRHGAGDMTNWLISKGIVTTRERRGRLEFLFSKKKFEEQRKPLGEYMARYGVRISDVDKLYKEGAEKVEQYLETYYNPDSSSKLSQQEYFTRYFGLDYVSAESQEGFLKVYKDIDGFFEVNAVDGIIEKMTFKVEGKDISGKELKDQSYLPEYKSKYINAIKDTMSLISSRHGIREFDFLYFRDGNVYNDKKHLSQRNQFTDLLRDLNIDFTFIDGAVHGWMKRGKFNVHESDNIFDTDSQYLTTNENIRLNTKRTDFIKSLDIFARNSNQFNEGIEIIRFGKSKLAVGVHKADFNTIKDAFKDRIYDQYYEQGSASQKTKISKVLDRMEASEGWNEAHTKALRFMVFQKYLKGGKVDRTLESLDYGRKDLANIATRFSLFYTPEFKALDKKLLDYIPPAEGSWIPILNHYKTRPELGLVEWHDKIGGSIEKRVEDQLNAKGVKFNEMMNGKQDDSGFDSIIYIRKRFRDLLNITYGSDSAVFKPAITSLGDYPLLLGKTVFVYEPQMETIFEKNPNLDMMITRTSDKLESIPNPIDKSVNDLINIGANELQSHMNNIRMDAVSIKMIPAENMPAKQSYSMFQYASSNEVSETFQTHYNKQIGNALTDMREIMSDPILRRLAVIELKKLGRDFTLDDLAESSSAAQYMGHMLEWMNTTREADPLVFGESMVMNILKSKFIDPLISPTSEFQGVQTGGKSVLKQSLFKRDMDVTIVKDGEVVQRGEVYLPHRIRGEAFIHKDGRVRTKAINKKTNSIEDIDKAFIKEDIKFLQKTLKLSKKDAKIQAEIDWKEISKTNEIGEMHDRLREISDDYQVGILVARYPRNKPNDLTLVRLKDFLEREEGNTAIMNDLDVYNIIEGDYDVDEIDYFWSHTNSTYNFVRKSAKTWVESPNPELLDPVLPSLDLLSDNPSEAKEWNTFDSNNRVLKKGIGVFQKTIDSMNHLADIGRYDADTKMYTILDYKDKNGQKVEVKLNWDNRDALRRLVMEGQLMIDFKSGVSHEILNKMSEWLGDYLFPSKDNSYSADYFDSNKRVMGFLKDRKSAQNPEGKRIRFFAKYVNGKEEDVLNNIEKDIVLHLMRKHGEFMTLATNIYDYGNPKKPGYDNIIEYGDNYFGHLGDVSSSTYRKLKRKYLTGPLKDDFVSMFGGEKRVYAKMKWKMDKDLESKDHYDWLTKTPFTTSAIQNAEGIKDGKRGSIFARSMNKVWDTDPLNNRNYETVFTGDLYKQMEYASRLILSENEIDISKIGKLMPRIIKDVNQAKGTISYYKGMIVKLTKANMNEKLKASRIDGLNKVIKSKEIELKPFLSREYMKTRKSKDLPRVNLVDIMHDKDTRLGTAQYWSMHFLHENSRVNQQGFKDSVADAHKLLGRYYSDLAGLKHARPFGDRTLPKEEMREVMRDPYRDGGTVQEKIQELISEGVGKYKAGWLWEFMMPFRHQTNLGVYQGEVMTIASKPNHAFRQGLIYLLNKKKTARTRQESAKIGKILELIAKRWSHYNNFFSGDIRLIPSDDNTLFHHLNNIPGIPEAFTTYAQRYDAINFKKDVFHRDIFGMGAEYGNILSFYRKLFDTANRKGEFNEAAEGLSYLHQLSSENRYMNPYSYQSLVSNLRGKLKEMGADKVLRAGITKKGDTSSLWDMPLIGAFEGSAFDSGFNLEPMGYLDGYRNKMTSRFLKQSREIVEAKPGDKWNEHFNRRKAGKCKGTI